MIINKKLHMLLALAIAISFLSQASNDNKALSQSDFYLPKSAFPAAVKTLPKKVQPAINSSNAIKPKIKETVKSEPIIKAIANPGIKSNLTPVIKPKIQTQATPPANLKTNSTIKPVAKPVTTVASVSPVSLSDYIRNFNVSYSNTFASTLFALSSVKAEILSFNSIEGKIYARLYNGKNLYILVYPDNNKTTSVRITPTDGVYNIPITLVQSIFNNITQNDTSKISNYTNSLSENNLN